MFKPIFLFFHIFKTDSNFFLQSTTGVQIITWGQKKKAMIENDLSVAQKYTLLLS